MPYFFHNRLQSIVCQCIIDLRPKDLIFFYGNLSCSLHGAQINIGAMPFPPYWGKRKVVEASGTSSSTCFGPDCEMVRAIGYALNFTFRVPAAGSWAEVSFRLAEEGGQVSCLI